MTPAFIAALSLVSCGWVAWLLALPDPARPYLLPPDVPDLLTAIVPLATFDHAGLVL